MLFPPTFRTACFLTLENRYALENPLELKGLAFPACWEKPEDKGRTTSTTCSWEQEELCTSVGFKPPATAM